MRFYASSRLRARSGHVPGTLCVFGHVVRELTEGQARSLDLLAHQVVDVLEPRRRTRLLTTAVGIGITDGVDGVAAVWFTLPDAANGAART
ncbi:hypothetical protein [Pseudonocardia acidicola]|uniref:Uncharacterized protein n=1 Tax=Pseudonocardia acidicola TaxID=2724939 RepID=A0ABX1S3V9_9PSEU|nr:hypothetical protein [Pseudonocardia acidicola]NMH95760.1 hypothetical protein [Pseudonocardia acidicola]